MAFKFLYHVNIRSTYIRYQSSKLISFINKWDELSLIILNFIDLVLQDFILLNELHQNPLDMSIITKLPSTFKILSPRNYSWLTVDFYLIGWLVEHVFNLLLHFIFWCFLLGYHFLIETVIHGHVNDLSLVQQWFHS